MKIERKWTGDEWKEINYSTLILDLAKHIERDGKASLVQTLNAFVCLLVLHSFETHEALYRLTEKSSGSVFFDSLMKEFGDLKHESEQLRARFKDQCRIIEEKRGIIQAIREWARGWSPEWPGPLDGNPYNQGKADGARDVLRLINSKGTGEGLKPGAAYGGSEYAEQAKPCGCLPSDMCCCPESEALKAEEDSRESFHTLAEFVREVAQWREKVHEYDADQGHDPRVFLDEDEWGVIEHHAQRTLDDCGIVGGSPGYIQVDEISDKKE